MVRREPPATTVCNTHTSAHTYTHTTYAHARGNAHVNHARAYTHSHTHTLAYSAHHVDIWFGVSLLTEQIAILWQDDGYGHVIWPPRTIAPRAVLQTSTRTRVAVSTCSRAHAHANAPSRMSKCNTCTHVRMVD